MSEKDEIKRHSVADPEYRYTKSRNIYWEKLNHLPRELQGLAFLDHATEEKAGNWREQFIADSKAKSRSSDTRLPLHVEVGCNAGHVVLEWAKQNPSQRYVGIDYKLKQIYRLAEKAAEAKVENLLAFRANIERLPFMFGKGEVDFLYMYFPDPWPKKGQLKNRTFNRNWLKRIAPILPQGGVFHVKTDHPGYFEFMLEEVAASANLFETCDLTWNLHQNHPDPKSLKIPEVTLFERLFIKDGLPIHSVKLIRK